MFDAVRTKNEIVTWIQNFFYENGPDCNAVIGISGGKDSTVAAALCVEALGADRVIGVLMPNGIQSDIDVARAIVKRFGIWHYEINIHDPYWDILNGMKYASIIPSQQTKINLPARLRMATLYAISQSMDGRVCNTCNLSEDWVGYATRYGDSVGDFSPLSMLLTSEIIEIGQALNIPDEFLLKTPIDGLCGKTDEESLGFSYDVLNNYIQSGFCDAGPIVRDRIDKMHEHSLFKLYTMPHYTPSEKTGVIRKLKYPSDIPMIAGE